LELLFPKLKEFDGLVLDLDPREEPGVLYCRFGNVYQNSRLAVWSRA